MRTSGWPQNSKIETIGVDFWLHVVVEMIQEHFSATLLVAARAILPRADGEVCVPQGHVTHPACGSTQLTQRLKQIRSLYHRAFSSSVSAKNTISCSCGNNKRKDLSIPQSPSYSSTNRLLRVVDGPIAMLFRAS